MARKKLTADPGPSTAWAKRAVWPRNAEGRLAPWPSTEADKPRKASTTSHSADHTRAVKGLEWAVKRMRAPVPADATWRQRAAVL